MACYAMKINQSFQVTMLDLGEPLYGQKFLDNSRLFFNLNVTIVCFNKLGFKCTGFFDKNYHFLI